jgi:Acetyltransferase (GNAT) domain
MAASVSHEIDPIGDPRWDRLVANHPESSVFHSVGWLAALQRTYRFKPVAYTSSQPGTELQDGLVFCEIDSWITGRRLVSLPFSDHCTPLLRSGQEIASLLGGVSKPGSRKYVELRPIALSGKQAGLAKSETFGLHRLDLRPSLEELFGGFHKDCVQRKIHRAEKEALTYADGMSESLLSAFYSLLRLTRGRQASGTQPIAWFRNLAASMGEKLKIRLVLKDGRPVASILTLRHKDTMVYKYGCSDKSLSRLGGTQLLFWKTIQEAKAEGLTELDLGRSDLNNPGLVTFKDRWGAQRTELNYWRLSGEDSPAPSTSTWTSGAVKRLLPLLPARVLSSASGLLYKHIG